MTLIQVCIPQLHPMSAPAIIQKMEDLLERRRLVTLTRREFLAQWRSLRDSLYNTRGYQEFVSAVWEKYDGICCECGEAGTEVHHKIRVAIQPSLALSVSNGRLLCSDCHDRQPGHQCLHRARRAAHTTTRATAVGQTSRELAPTTPRAARTGKVMTFKQAPA